jgi:diguanylate cyclase (GGDEF)-like protein
MQRTEAGTSNPQVVSAFRSFATGAGVLAAAIGVLVLVGWASDIQVFKSVLPDHVEMKVNTALAMLATGLALVACRSERRSVRPLSGVLSLGVLVLGALTLAQYVGGFDVGIDTLWHDDPRALALGRPPGRMSGLSSIAFVLLGAIGLSSCLLRWMRMAQVLALAVMAIALYALSTYGYLGLDEGGRSAFSPVALHTALLFLVLALGWLAARPEVGLMRVLSARSFGGSLARRALLPSILVPSLLSYLAQQLQARGVLSPDTTITLLAVTSGGLVAWIIWSVSTLLDRVEREQRITDHLREDAGTDVLTRLPNRREFQSAIEGLLRHRREQDRHFALLMLDLDRFKDFNDSHGHVAGDQALRLVGQLLKAALRPGDMAARYGGEEFAVLLPGLDLDRALRVAERIRRDFHIADWPHAPITVSIGIAQARQDDDEESLVARADRALYAAKATGRDRAVAEGAPAPGPAQSSA